MRILVTGATGLIGSTLSARLRGEGHDVIGLVRSAPRRSLNHARLFTADMASLTSEDDWRPYLDDIDAVVNCAGLLQSAPGASLPGVHSIGAAALFRACRDAGISRVIHLSAIGVDRETPTEFSRSKRAGEEALMALDLEWVILRPSVVVGKPAYGGSALFRGLAALPILPVPPQGGELQIVQLEEIVQTIVFFLSKDAPSRLAIDVAGPERLRFEQVVLIYRHWFGWDKPWTFKLPNWLMGLFNRGGDLLGLLGWRPPMRSTAGTEMLRGAVGDNRQWTTLTGIRPRSLGDALASEAPSVQERWFAQLYFLKPLALGVFAAFWIATGLISFGPGWGIGMSLMRAGEVEEIGPLLIAAGASADIIIGLGMLFRRTARLALWAALLLSIGYIFIGTFLVPQLWADPLGPMMKIWPILVFNLMALAILSDR